MKTSHLVLIISLLSLAACNKASAPAKPADAVEQKLQQYSGTPATNCGRLNLQATDAQSKAASDCALQASQANHAFYVAYDMPGMTVGVAGNADGKLFAVQSQGGEGASPTITGGDCPAQLRVAQSGRITCFAPGGMGSMGGHPAAGAMPPGMANPHGGDMENSHPAPPSETMKN